MIARKQTGRKRKSRGGVNKAEEIRAVLTDRGIDTSPKEVIATLAEKGLQVAPAQVSNIKAVLRKKSKGRRRGAKSSPKKDSISLSALVEAKKLVDQLGSVDAVKRALGALEKLR